MKKRFNIIYDEERLDKGKYYIEIPFNVWDTFGNKGRVKVICEINEFSYDTTLIPKGSGHYVLMLTKKMRSDSKLISGDKISISIQLQNIVKPQIATMEERLKIDNIIFRKQPTNKTCGTACVAMLINKSVEEVIDIVGKKPMGIGKIVEVLDKYSIRHSEKNIKISKKNPSPSDISILTVKFEDHNHYILLFKGKYYDPARGVLDNLPEGAKITMFLEIHG